MKYLIVNADDFGYSPGVNKGIIEGHTNGIVTSTSVMVDAVAAHEAKELTKFPNLSIGLHFDAKEGNDVQAELERQIAQFTAIVGWQPDHLDSHKKHTTTQGIKEALEAYAQKLHIPVRDFGYAKFIDIFFGFNANGDVSVSQLKKAIDQATDEYNEIMCHVGYADDYLRGHSSYSGPREEELQSICSPEIKGYLKEKGLELCNWSHVPR
ncbi:MAG TPA: ChbG/HpnK family deacetylase [Candidatus Saccharimonadales bacterium]